MFRVEKSLYELVPRTRLGSRAAAVPRQGSLLKFQFDDGFVGYSDCFPWPELGDDPLAIQLEKLNQGMLTDLTQRSLVYAKEDAIARAQKQSLWRGLQIPPSHCLVGDVLSVSPEWIESKIMDGFSHFKFKMGSNWKVEAKKLLELGSLFQSTNRLIRLDLNSSLSPKELESFLKVLRPILDRIDFIEDPCPYHAKAWTDIQTRWQVRFALDRWPSLPDWKPKLGSFRVLILKPAIQDSDRIVRLAQELMCSLVVTSYLDHPLGQLSAAWVAARVSAEFPGRVETCGLLSQTVYEENPFSKQLQSNGPRLIPPSHSFGFGFDSDLKNLKWERL